MTLYLFDDARARDWTPFATTRPVGELLLGCLLLRERAERFWGAECAGALVDRDLAGFAEAGTPPIFHDVPVPSGEPLILFSSRAAPNLVAAPPPLPSTETTAKLMIGDEPVGWIVPPGAAPPSIGDLMSPDTATPEAPTVQIKGNVVGRPWDLIAMNGAQIREDMPAWSTGGHSSIPEGVHCVGAEQISLGHGVHLEPGVVLDASNGPIHLSDNVEVRAFTRLAGPAFVGEGTRLLGGAFEAVSIGPHCKIRGEVGSSVVLGYSNKAHDGYLGHSYLGKWVNLGALTTTSDLKNTYGTVRAPTPEGLVDTGLQKIGSMIGDHAKTGIGTMLSTGSVIGAGSNLFGDVMPPRSVPPFTWGGRATLLRNTTSNAFSRWPNVLWVDGALLFATRTVRCFPAHGRRLGRIDRELRPRRSPSGSGKPSLGEPPVKVCVLGTGSRGNATLVEADDTRVLVDAGFSGKDLERRLLQVGLTPEAIDAIVISHDHGDHTRGAGVFSRRHGTPVYMTERTLAACSKIFRGTEPTITYRSGRQFEIGSIRIEPFMTVHDAADPVAVALVDTKTETRIGVATDLGRPNAQIRLALANADFLILEANHDEEMLRTGPYPWAVQQRIASSHGHLSNHAAARFVSELMHPRLAGVLLAHLSQECNRPELAKAVVGNALKAAGFEGFLGVAPQDQPTELIDIEELRLRMGPAQLTFL